jgi:hypothetical protein
MNSFLDFYMGIGVDEFIAFWTIDRAEKRTEKGYSLPCQRSLVSALGLLSSIALSPARVSQFYHAAHVGDIISFVFPSRAKRPADRHLFLFPQFDMVFLVDISSIQVDCVYLILSAIYELR